MKTRLALVVLLIAAGIVIVALLRFPGPRRAAPPAQPARPQPKPTAGSPRQVVTAYLAALQNKDFRTAYGHLSRASRQAHPYDEFVALCEKSGVPSYDLAGAEEKPEEGGEVTVTVPLSEDPAGAGFTTVQETGAWKVVFISGAPSFPYP